MPSRTPSSARLAAAAAMAVRMLGKLKRKPEKYPNPNARMAEVVKRMVKNKNKKTKIENKRISKEPKIKVNKTEARKHSKNWKSKNKKMSKEAKKVDRDYSKAATFPGKKVFKKIMTRKAIETLEEAPIGKAIINSLSSKKNKDKK